MEPQTQINMQHIYVNGFINNYHKCYCFTMVMKLFTYINI